MAALLAAQPGFQRELDYSATHLPALVSRDGRYTLVLAAFADQDRSAAAVAHVRPELAGSGVRFGGNDVAFHEINERTTSDLKRAETLAFPILLLLSFWVFRGLIAAALPLLVGGFAIVITFLLLRLIDQVPRAVDLRRQPRHRHRAGAGHRLQPVRALALPRGARARPGMAQPSPTTGPRSRARCRPPGAPCCTAR